MNQFKKFLKAQLAYLHKLADQDECADTDFDDAGSAVAEAARRASLLGLSTWARFAACEQLAPQRAREILAACSDAIHINIFVRLEKQPAFLSLARRGSSQKTH